MLGKRSGMTLLDERGSWRQTRIAHEAGNGTFLLKNQASAMAQEVLVPMEP